MGAFGRVTVAVGSGEAVAVGSGEAVAVGSGEAVAVGSGVTVAGASLGIGLADAVDLVVLETTGDGDPPQATSNTAKSVNAMT